VFYLKETLSKRIIQALGVAMLGITVLVSSEYQQILTRPTGVVVMLGAAFCWSVGNIALSANEWVLKPTARAAWLFAVASILSLPVVWFFERSEVTSLQLPSWSIVAAMIFHILGPMVTCYVLWSYLLARIPVAIAAISILTAPVVGVLSSVVWLGDALTWHKLVALLLIVTSIAIIHVGRVKR